MEPFLLLIYFQMSSFFIIGSYTVPMRRAYYTHPMRAPSCNLNVWERALTWWIYMELGGLTGSIRYQPRPHWYQLLPNSIGKPKV